MSSTVKILNFVDWASWTEERQSGPLPIEDVKAHRTNKKPCKCYCLGYMSPYHKEDVVNAILNAYEYPFTILW